MNWTGFLKQGITPEKLAFSVALGIILGVFPVLGSTTLLCALAGYAWGLNQPAIQSVNYLVYPLQIVLLIPFYRWGEKLFHVPESLITLAQVRHIIETSVVGAMHALWTTTWHAIVVWCLVAPPTGALLYLLLKPAFRRLAKAHS